MQYATRVAEQVARHESSNKALQRPTILPGKARNDVEHARSEATAALASRRAAETAHDEVDEVVLQLAEKQKDLEDRTKVYTAQVKRYRRRLVILTKRWRRRRMNTWQSVMRWRS